MTEELNEIEEVSEIDTEEQERLERERIEQEERERLEREQERLEQARIEHENLLKSFPEGTIFYQYVEEKDGYKCLTGVTDNPSLADSLGFLENHISDSELTLKNGIFYLKGYEKPDDTIEELKAKKLAEIKAVADQYAKYECGEMYLTSSKGFRINADHKSQDNIRGLIALGQPCAFKDFDNVFHANTSIDDLNTMLTECYANGASLYQQKFEYEARVDAAQSREDLYFDVIFDMADFSAK